MSGWDLCGWNDKWTVGSVEFDDVIFWWLRCIQEFVQLGEVLDFGSVDFFDNKTVEAIHAGCQTIIFDASQDDDVFHFCEEAFGDIVGVDLTQTAVVEFIAREEIEVERLEDETREEAISRSDLILNGVDLRVGELGEGDFGLLFFAFTEEGEGDFVSCELPLNDFVHIDELTTDFDVAGAIDDVVIDFE